VGSEGQPSGPAYLGLVGLGALLGIPAALVAALFLGAVHDLQHLLWTDLPSDLGHSSPPAYLVILLPAAGAVVCLAARRLLPGDGGNPPIEGIGSAPLPIRAAAGIAVAALGTLAFGAVLGPEAPLIALGGITGLAVTYFFKRVPEQAKPVVSTAGSFSAISSLFGGPIVGGMMMVEGALGLGARILPVLLPGFVAAAVGYVLFIGFGKWGGLGSESLAYPTLPPYHGTHLYDLLIAIVVGIAAASVISAVRHGAEQLMLRGPKRIGVPALLIGGGLAVGLIAQTAGWLGANSQDVLFSGQTGVPDLEGSATTKIVLILLVAKGLGYAISLGCGFRGGPIFPAIFLGIAVATFPVVWFGTSTTVAVATGSAAGIAAGTRLLFTPVLFGALLVGTNGLDAVPAAVLAASAAWLTMQFIGLRRDARPESPAEEAVESARPR
jgi:H+/Cl- antiporter ClcA